MNENTFIALQTLDIRRGSLYIVWECNGLLHSDGRHARSGFWLWPIRPHLSFCPPTNFWPALRFHSFDFSLHFIYAGWIDTTHLHIQHHFVAPAVLVRWLSSVAGPTLSHWPFIMMCFSTLFMYNNIYIKSVMVVSDCKWWMALNGECHARVNVCSSRALWGYIVDGGCLCERNDFIRAD